MARSIVPVAALPSLVYPDLVVSMVEPLRRAAAYSAVLKTRQFYVDEQTFANMVRGSAAVRAALVEVFVEELARV